LDKAGKSHWDGFWDVRAQARPESSRFPVLRGYRNAKQAEFMRQALTGIETQGKKVLELGCGDSVWLPYFAKEYGFEVWGLDYSEIGCELARNVLRRENLSGEIICGDIFSPPQSILGTFDLMISFGVLEHYEDLQSRLKLLARFLKPGGLMLTSIPNFRGAVGWMQKVLGPRIYETHVPWKKRDFEEQLTLAGFQLLDCRYVLLHDFAICIVDPPTAPKDGLFAFLKAWTGVAMLFENKFGYFPLNRITASYIYSLCRKPS